MSKTNKEDEGAPNGCKRKRFVLTPGVILKYLRTRRFTQAVMENYGTSYAVCENIPKDECHRCPLSQ